MLLDLEDNEITDIPRSRKEFYDLWKENLTQDDYRGVIDAVKEYLDTAKEKDTPVYSSHIPGKLWEGTPYMAIYLACKEDWQTARFLFGLLVWEAVIEHEDAWTFMQDERSDDSHGGKIYFLKQP